MLKRKLRVVNSDNPLVSGVPNGQSSSAYVRRPTDVQHWHVILVQWGNQGRK